MAKKAYISFLALLLVLTSCNFFLGKKEDDTTNDIFNQGKIDPNLIPQSVGYVPILPYFKGYSHPVDIFAGYDEMIYIVDDAGVHVVDQKGTQHRLIAIPGATDVTQDRRLHTYIAGRVTQNINGTDYSLPAVYHLINTATIDGPFFIDTIIHPFSDVSRNQTSFRGADDEKVFFTGIACTEDNSLFVSRTGPTNNLSSLSFPDNAVLFFDPNGINNGYASGLNPNTSSLKSSLGISSIATFATPPQRLFGVEKTRDFLITQADDNPNVEFRVLWLKEFYDPDLGSRTYTENATMLNFDTSKSSRFLYESFRFGKPEDVFVSTDANGYIFVVDSKKDSLYQFTRVGYEGVNPPATYTSTKQVIASFGGKGNGPFQFDQPSGVCFFRKTLYVADKGNGRICRFKLSTDIE